MTFQVWKYEIVMAQEQSPVAYHIWWYTCTDLTDNILIPQPV